MLWHSIRTNNDSKNYSGMLWHSIHTNNDIMLFPGLIKLLKDKQDILWLPLHSEELVMLREYKHLHDLRSRELLHPLHMSDI